MVIQKTKKTFCGPRLKGAREQLGLSVSALSKATGLARVLIDSWETGGSRPNLRSLCTLESFFDCGLEYFFIEELVIGLAKHD